MAKNEIIRKILMHAEKNPEKIAFEIYKKDSLTYREISTIYTSFDSFFNSSPVKNYERIALITEQALFILPLAIGIMEHATYVSIEADLNLESMLDLVKLYNVDYILTDEVSDSLERLAKETGIGLIVFDVLGKDLQFRLIKQPTHDTRLPVKKEELTYINKTSGTTSTPKLIPIDYQGMCVRLYRAIYDYQIQEEDVIIQAIRMNRVTSVIAVIRLLFVNGSAIATEGIIPENIVQILKERRINNFDMPPAGLVALSQYLTSKNIKLNLDHELVIFSTGSALNQSVLESLKKSTNARVVRRYGMTEVSSIASTFRTSEDYKTDSVGILDDVEVAIIEQEICVRGRTGFNGYENVSNEDAFIDGWFRTGDVGYLDEEGYLFITGRIKEMINRGGEKISPYELEAILLGNPSLDDVAIFPYPSASGFDEVGAAIVFKENQNCSLRQIRAYLRDRVSSFKMPTLLYDVHEIPKSSDNKIQRRMLYSQLSGNTAAITEKLDSRTIEDEVLKDTEESLKRIWQEILCLELLSIDDNFLELGGDSLKAAALYTEVAEAFNQSFPMDLFYQHHTVREMASFIDSMKDSAERNFHVVPMRRSESNTVPLIFIHALDGDIASYHVIMKHLNSDRPIYGMRSNFNNPSFQDLPEIKTIARVYADEISLIQPRGPYCLCGLSIGGLIAMEIAGLLIEKGHQIKFVAALDTVFPAVRNRISLKNKIRNYYKISDLQKSGAGLFKMLSMLLVKSTKLAWSKIDRLFFEKRKMEERSRRMAESYKKIEEKFRDGERGFNKSEKRLILKRAMVGYRMQFLDFPIIYFRALRTTNQASVMFLKQNARLVNEVAMNCMHVDFVKEAYACETARHLERYLQE